jgi:hypothetical protein
VKNNPNRVASPLANLANAVPECHAIIAAGPLDGPAVNSEQDGVSLCKRYDSQPRLHARPLFRHHKLSALKIAPGLRK